MKIESLDILIILLYLASTVVIGLVLKKQAEKDKASYLLGGNSMPWYMLTLSNASGMFDIAGTMWLVTLLFVYGMKSIWIPWLWPVFNQIFMMVYLSKWLRKSNVTTGAEWIGTRFGFDKGARMSHIIVVIFALFNCLGFLAYGFIGLGKFIEIFIPWEYVSQFVHIDISEKYVPHVYGILFTVFAIFYSLLGGMVSIVWADLIQYIIMTISAFVIAFIAMSTLMSHDLIVPDGWMSPFFGWELNMDWSGIIPEVMEKVESDGFSLFSIFMMMMIFKGGFVGLAGPAPTFDLQKILATKSAAEASKMSGFVSVFLMPTRYLLIAGLAVLGILYYDQLDLVVAGKVDFEQILPSAISEFVPVGLTGLLLAGLLAAFISTFAGTLNAAQAYIVNDIYLKFVNPDANKKQLRASTYISGIAVVIVSIVIGFSAESINSIMQWIVSALWGSYVASNVLKWYWWRFNSEGFFWGMVTGLVSAVVFPYIFTETLELYYFPLLFLVSIGGCVAGTYAYPATDEEVLKSFYKNIKPWGFWKPILDKVKAEDPTFEGNKDFKKDMFNIFVGIIMQTTLVALPIYIVLMQTTPIIISIVITLICGYILKKTWWDKLSEA